MFVTRQVNSRSLLAERGRKRVVDKTLKLALSVSLSFFLLVCLFSGPICIYYDSSRCALLWLYFICFVMNGKRDLSHFRCICLSEFLLWFSPLTPLPPYALDESVAPDYTTLPAWIEEVFWELGWILSDFRRLRGQVPLFAHCKITVRVGKP